MKVMLDGLLLFLNSGQVGNYSRSLVDNVLKYSDINLNISKDYEIDSNNYKNNSIELLLNRKYNDFSNLSMYLKNHNYDLYHCLNNGFSIPKNYDFNYVMTINNLLPIFCEELCPSSYVHNYFSKLPYGVLNSSFIVCPSFSTRENFLGNFSMDSDKIFINYGVVSKFYRKMDLYLSSVYVKSKFNIEGKLIVFSGDFHRRKNLDKSLILFSKLKTEDSQLKFLILSFEFKDCAYLDELKNLCHKLNIHNDVFFISNISTMDKVNIFNSSLFFLDLSSYEDVNLDIVEAFSCSLPIICSDIDLYQEYFGDLAFYININSNPNYISLLDYVSRYTFSNSDFVLSKFDYDINLKSTLNVYNKFVR
ncbi:MAG: glycosyltransferase [Cetobacterium sp.]